MSWIGRVAYEAWVAAAGMTGVNITKGYDDILQDERYQWDAVAEAVIRASSNTTGMTTGAATADTLPPPPPAATERAPAVEGAGVDPEVASAGTPSQKGE